MRLYVDGVELFTQTGGNVDGVAQVQNIASTNDPFGVGYLEGYADRSGQYKNAYCRVYDRAMTAEEIAQQMNADLGTGEYAIASDSENTVLWLDYTQATVDTVEASGIYDYYAEVDEGVNTGYAQDMAGRYFAYGGLWGDVINDNNFCQNGLVGPDRSIQDELYEVKYQYQKFWFEADTIDILNHKFSVTNESSVTDLSAYDVSYVLTEDGTVIDEGELELSCIPHGEAEFTVPFEMPETPAADAEYYLTINKATGTIENYIYNDQVVMTKGPVATYWLSGVWDNAENEGSNRGSYDKAWQNADSGVTVQSLNVTEAEDGTSVTVSVDWNLPNGYENVIWYGNGPWETLRDRQSAGLIGLYENTVFNSLYPYPRPQASGNRTEVRYIAVEDPAKEVGILVVSDSVMEAGTTYYAAHDLDRVDTTYAMPITDYTILNVDYGTRGTGGATCGPDTLSPYKLLNDGRDYSYTYTIVPYLTDDQKALVENYDVLLAAEAKIESLMGARAYILDKSVYANDAEITGTANIVKNEEAPSGYAFTGGYSVPDSDGRVNAALSGTSKFTVEFWVNPSDLAANNGFFMKGDTQVSLKTTNTGLEAFCYVDGWHPIVDLPCAQIGFNANEWNHVAWSGPWRRESSPA